MTMDPVSQGVTGAILSQSISEKSELRPATVIGALSAMSADLDILIRSASDPLLVVEYHRHFTHSLVFIPFGAIFSTLILWSFFRNRLSFARTFLYSAAGYTTAGLLDAFTSYGTSLYWPFSETRVAWNMISVVDPVFTITLLILVLLSYKCNTRTKAIAGIIFACMYLCAGAIQNHRAEEAVEHLAESRGHKTERIFVHPALGNIILWRSIYEYDGMYHVDAVRAGIFSGIKMYEGQPIEKYDIKTDSGPVRSDSTLYRDLERFRHFTLDFMVFHPERENVIGDIRYSYLPNGTKPLWGIWIDYSKPDEHVKFTEAEQSVDDLLRNYMLMLIGESLEYVNGHDK